MDIIRQLQDIYGYEAPILLKDIRIGHKSRTAIKQALYRATKQGRIARESNGVYYFRDPAKRKSLILFEKVVEQKFIQDNAGNPLFANLFVYGYYSGATFLNMIGLSPQVPAVLEVVTNRTSSKKYTFQIGRQRAFVRKAKTEITSQNARILQFLDMFSYLGMDEVMRKKEQIVEYANKTFSRGSIVPYLKYYPTATLKKLFETGIADAI